MARRLVTLLFLTLLLWLTFRQVLAQASPCDTADQLREAGLYDDAEKAYVTLLKADPQLTCARDGIQAVVAALGLAAQHYEEGRALEAAGDTDAAVTAYIEAITVFPRHAEAHAAIVRLVSDSASADESFDPVRRLAGQGLYTAATEQLVEVLKKNPWLDVPGDLAYLAEGGILVWPALQRFSRRWLVPLIPLVVPVLLVVILVVVAYFLGRSWLNSLFRYQVDIQPFTKGPKDLEVGAGMAALMEEKLIPESKVWRLDLVEGDLAYFAIPDNVRKAIPSLWLLDLLVWALPRKILVVNGNLLIEGKQGPGVTLSLVDKRTGTIVDVTSLWDRNLNPGVATTNNDPVAEPYYRLVNSAVDWLVSLLALSP